MTASWAAVAVAALIAGGGFTRYTMKLAALLERLTAAAERHEVMLMRHDAEIAELLRAQRRRLS